MMWHKKFLNPEVTDSYDTLNPEVTDRILLKIVPRIFADNCGKSFVYQGSLKSSGDPR